MVINLYNNFEKNKLYLFYFPCLIVYFEMVLKISIFRTLMNLDFIYIALFSIPVGLVMNLLTTNWTERINKIIFILFTLFLTIVYVSQLVYYKVFSTFLSLYSFIGANQAMQFWKEILRIVFKNILIIMLLLAPLILIIILNKKIGPIIKRNSKFKAKIIVVAVITQVIVTCVVLNSKTGDMSSNYLYSQSFIIDMCVERFGLLTTERLDLKNLFVSFSKNKETNKHISKNSAKSDVNPIFNNDVITDEKTLNIVEKKEITYNVMNIDFDKLIENEQDEEIKDMHDYFSRIEPTNKNDYTGKYKGKNLILITAEGFSPYAVNKDVTPTLYKMYEEGFKFTDFYTPLWGVSTSDGEYVACTGLIPKSGIWSMYSSSENYMPFCMGNQLRSLGYNTFAYHNHYFDYYKRNSSHPNMGYVYKGLGNGLDVKETWPESDLDMMNLTVPEYVTKQPFHIYYMTVSGHLRYSFEGNAMSKKNKEAVKDLNYSDSVKAYLACNIEFDKAMEVLISELEDAGIADDTLIAISPDHYPYGLEISEISELAGHDVETNFELYKSVFLLWSKGMSSTIINEPCSSLDIIPTLSNLMGLEYDSRLVMGRDIMSDKEPLVLFLNRSWITDKATYNSLTGELKSKNNYVLDSTYEQEISEKVKKKFKYSSLILERDYYGRILE